MAEVAVRKLYLAYLARAGGKRKNKTQQELRTLYGRAKENELF